VHNVAFETFCSTAQNASSATFAEHGVDPLTMLRIESRSLNAALMTCLQGRFRLALPAAHTMRCGDPAYRRTMSPGGSVDVVLHEWGK
jgi:hypothetical protein